MRDPPQKRPKKIQSCLISLHVPHQIACPDLIVSRDRARERASEREGEGEVGREGGRECARERARERDREKEKKRNQEREREKRGREKRERERKRESLLKDLPALSSGKELGVLFQDFLYVLLVFVGPCVVFN